MKLHPFPCDASLDLMTKALTLTSMEVTVVSSNLQSKCRHESAAKWILLNLRIDMKQSHEALVYFQRDVIPAAVTCSSKDLIPGPEGCC